MIHRRAWLWPLAALAVVAVAIVVYFNSGRSVSGTNNATAASRNAFLPEHAPDQGWPFLRGPHYDGHSPEIHLANSWPEAGPPVLWSRALGQGYSGFVAQGDRVFTQAQTLAGQNVLCLHADTGETIWEHHYDWPYDTAGVYPGPRATPTLYENRVYFASPNGLIGCLDARSGEEAWSVNVVEKYKARGVDFGYACSPTVLEGRVILPVGGRGASLVALNAHDGRELWKSGDDSASYTPAFPITHGGRPLVIGYLENVILCCDRATGEMLWRHALSSGYDEHAAWPIYREPHLWTSGPFRSGSTLWKLPENEDSLSAFAPRKHATFAERKATKLSTAWSSRLLSNDVMSSVLVGNHLYGFDLREPQAKTQRTSRGVFRCLEFATGKPAWSVGDAETRRATGLTIGHASLIVAEGKLLLLNDTGELILARANPERYEELDRASVLPGEICWTPPALHRGRVYVRNHSRAACIYVGEPELLEESLRQTATTVDELPRSLSLDWTHLLLPVEPEYAFDAPHAAWLWEWFGWCVAMLAAAWVLTSLAILCRAGFQPASASSSLAGWKPAPLLLAAIAGAVGTPLLSTLRQDFIFTWPLTLWAVFHLAALALPWQRRGLDPAAARRSLWAALAIGLACGVYFWLCRRLSLVFEWAFLAGLFPAVLGVAADRWVATKRWSTWPTLAALAIASLLGFTLFYACGVGLLWWRYL